MHCVKHIENKGHFISSPTMIREDKEARFKMNGLPKRGQLWEGESKYGSNTDWEATRVNYALLTLTVTWLREFQQRSSRDSPKGRSSTMFMWAMTVCVHKSHKVVCDYSHSSHRKGMNVEEKDKIKDIGLWDKNVCTQADFQGVLHHQ